MSGPLPRAVRPLAVPLAWAYGLAVAARTRRFDRGRGVHRVSVPVISIGNLTAGGTGKTPVVQWAARRLGAAGHRPAIALRGYGAGAADRAASDEAQEHVEGLPGMVVLPDPDRVAAITAALAGDEPPDVVVLDDGFQHRRLARDLDVVLIDARAGTLHDRLLPVGWLREPVDALRRADAIVITHASAVDSTFAAAVETAAGRPPVAWTRHRWAGLRTWSGARPLTGDGATDSPVAWLADRAIAVMAGVARPAGIEAMATEAGARVVHVEPVRDHHRHDAAGWARADARARAAGASALLVTRKDRVKLARLAPPPGGLPVVEPRLELAFLRGEATLAAMIEAAAAQAAGPPV